MKSSKYSIIIIPDNDDAEKQFSLSRSALRLMVVGLFLLGVFLIFFVIYALPKMMKISKYEAENERYIVERVQIMELMQDLNRIEQMDRQIRKTLGSELQIPSDTSNMQDRFSDQSDVAVSYIDNVPSHIPVEGFITQKVHIKSIYKDQNHYGVDIAVKEGEPVYAAATGFVVFSGWTYNFGNYIILYHGDDYFSIYGHNKLNFADTKDFVKRGDVIASAGGTGIASGPHLHFEVWKNGKAVDPFKLFPNFNSKDISANNYE